MDNRPTKIQTYLALCHVISKRTTCSRAEVGALITTSDLTQIVSMGYSGAPSGVPHCIDIGCTMAIVRERERCVSSIHAEVNACLRIPDKFKNQRLTMFCTHSPCFECLKICYASNIRKVYYLNHYDDAEAWRCASLWGIEMIQGKMDETDALSKCKSLLSVFSTCIYGLQQAHIKYLEPCADSTEQEQSFEFFHTIVQLIDNPAIISAQDEVVDFLNSSNFEKEKKHE